MEIIKTNLQFDRFYHTKRSATDYHIVHHADAPFDVDAKTINEWHKNREPKFYGCGYNFVIRMNGDVEEGRPHWAIGAHAGASANGKSVGTCLAGRFTPVDHPTKPGKPPTEAQIKSLVELHKWLENEYSKKLLLMGHKDFMSTECPGVLFPMESVRELITGPVRKASEVKLNVNGKSVNIPLRIVDGRTEALLSGSWVQIRALAELLHAEIGWNATTRTVDLIVK